jgi:beta-fructofuranosidase
LSLHVILQGDRDERPLGVVAYDGGKRELSVTLPGTEDGTEDGAEGSSPGSVPNRCELPPAADGRIHLRLFVDRSSLEVFANDGEAVITRRMYPNGQDIRVRLRNAGGALNIEEVRLWSLRSIWQGGGA